MAKGLSARSVQFEEIDQHHTTYKNDPDSALTSSDIGKAVVLVANATVGLGWDGARIKGILKVVEGDGHVVVQDAGYKEKVGYSTLPAVGDRVVSDGAGKVKPSASDAAVGDHEVVSVDTENEEVILHLQR